MKESVGSIPLYNIIFAFLIITFSFLAGTLAYSKAFRVSTKIINTLEIFDGYNPRSVNEINRILGNLGYRKTTSLTNTNCPTRKDAKKTELSNDSEFFYCIYEYEIKMGNDYYYYWGAAAFMYFDMPFIGELIQIPIYTASDTYYRFPKEFPISG